MKLFDLDKLFASLQGYIETKIELLKLDAQDELKKLIASLVVFLLISASVIFAIFFASFGLSQFLNNALNSIAAGYLIVAVFYIFIGSIFYSRRSRIKQSVLNKGEEDNE